MAHFSHVEMDEDEEQLTLDRINRRPSRLVYLLTLLSGIGGFLVGYDAGSISGALILLKDEFALTYKWQAVLISATVAAAGVFALVSGFFNERFGRRPVILCGSFVFALGAVLMAVASSVTVLVTGRIIVGIGIGLVSMTAPVYIAEIAPAHLRGRLVSSNMVLIAAGQFTASCVDGIFAFEAGDGWRWMLGFGAIPSAVQFVGFVFMPESPRWLLTNGQHEAAKMALRKVRGDMPDADDEFDLMRINIEEKSRGNGATATRSIIQKAFRQPSLRRALMVGCGLQMFQQFVGINTVMYYSATIIQMAGLREKTVILWLAAGISAANFFCSFIGVYLVEKIGRRPLTLFSLLGVFCSLIVLAIGFQTTAVSSPLVTFEEDFPAAVNDMCRSHVTCEACIESSQCGFCYQVNPPSTDVAEGSCSAITAAINDYTHSAYGRCANITVAADKNIFWTYDACPTRYSWIPVLGLVLYLLSFSSGMGPMPWTINSEIYPVPARNAGTALATATNWFCNLLVSSTFLLLVQSMTKYGVFWLYSVAAVLGLIFVYFVVPETKGRDLEEVEGLFAVPWTVTQTAHSVLPGDKPVQYVHIRGLNRDGQKSMDSDDSD